MLVHLLHLRAPPLGPIVAFAGTFYPLAEVKAIYDPENFFRLSNNVVPAA